MTFYTIVWFKEQIIIYSISILRKYPIFVHTLLITLYPFEWIQCHCYHLPFPQKHPWVCHTPGLLMTNSSPFMYPNEPLFCLQVWNTFLFRMRFWPNVFVSVIRSLRGDFASLFSVFFILWEWVISHHCSMYIIFLCFMFLIFFQHCF